MSLADIREDMRYCGSFDRAPKLVQIWLTQDVRADDWLTVLGEEWSSCDGIGHFLDHLIDDTPLGDVLGDPEYAASVRNLMMTDAENEAYAALPDKVTIYRGCYAENKWGLSWTLDRDTAAGFPLLHRYRQEGQPLLVKAVADKSRIAFLKLSRSESEVVIYRPRHVSTSHIRQAATQRQAA